jgi:cold shock CspA family protein
MIGQITFWDERRAYGFVDSQVKKSYGTEIKTFFLHKTYIRFTAVEQVKVGQVVQFTVGAIPTGKSYPLAMNVVIADTPEQLQHIEERQQAEKEQAKAGA